MNHMWYLLHIFFIETILNESNDDMKVGCNVGIEVRGNKF